MPPVQFVVEAVWADAEDGADPSSSLLLSSLELSDAKVYAPQIRALLGTAAHFCEVVAHPLSSGREQPT